MGVILNVPGRHNVQNALATITVGLELDLTPDQIRSGLVHYRGVDRRFQIKAEWNGITVVDDYGHHPAEIRTVVDAAVGALFDFFADHPTVPKLLVRRLLENDGGRVDIERDVLVPAWRVFAGWTRALSGRRLQDIDWKLFMPTVHNVMLLFLLDSRHFTSLLGGSVRQSDVRRRVRTHIINLVHTLLARDAHGGVTTRRGHPGDELPSGMRYRMLDTIHAYAHEKLVESGEEAVLRDRHLVYFFHFVEQVAPRLKSAEQPERLRQLEAERENLRAAMSWALVERVSGQEDALNRIEMGLHMGNELAYFWDSSSLFPGIINWLRDGLARLDALKPDRKALRARTLYTLGVLNRVVHNYASARQAWEESIELLRECGDFPVLSLALADLSWLLEKIDPPLALSLVKESEAAARQVGNLWDLGYALLVSMVITRPPPTPPPTELQPR